MPLFLLVFPVSISKPFLGGTLQKPSHFPSGHSAFAKDKGEAAPGGSLHSQARARKLGNASDDVFCPDGRPFDQGSPRVIGGEWGKMGFHLIPKSPPISNPFAVSIAGPSSRDVFFKGRFVMKMPMNLPNKFPYLAPRLKETLNLFYGDFRRWCLICLVLSTKVLGRDFFPLRTALQHTCYPSPLRSAECPPCPIFV